MTIVKKYNIIPVSKDAINSVTMINRNSDIIDMYCMCVALQSTFTQQLNKRLLSI